MSYFTKISAFYGTKCTLSLYLFKPVLRVLGNALQVPTQSNRKGPLVIHTPAYIDSLFPSIFWLVNHPLKLHSIHDELVWELVYFHLFSSFQAETGASVAVNECS